MVPGGSDALVLGVGASIAEGAYIDHPFNSVDVCIVLPTAQLTRKYLRHYERVIERGPSLPTDCGTHDKPSESRLVATA